MQDSNMKQIHVYELMLRKYREKHKKTIVPAFWSEWASSLDVCDD